MRLAIIQNLYKNYIETFQKVKKDQLTSYNDCLSVLQEDSFSWSGAWGDILCNYDIEVFELYVNYSSLNYWWCIEKGIQNDTLSTEDILIRQLKDLKIDIILNTDVKILKSNFIKRVKETTKVKHAYAHICSPYFSYLDITEYDGIFTCLHHYVRLFNEFGKKAIYLPHAFNLKILRKTEQILAKPKINKIFFAGGVLKGKELHDDREELLLEFVKRNLPLEFYSELFYYNRVKGYSMASLKKSVYFLIKILRLLSVKDTTLNKIPVIKEGLSWKYLPGDIVNKVLLKIANKPLYGIELFSIMQGYTTSLNIHGGAAQDEAANMRLFEATGVGSALVTDYKSNLSDFFDIDTEVLTYKSIPEAIEKAKFLIDNPSVAEQMGVAAKKRVLKDHTFQNRAPIIANALS